jgi:phasin family protein
LTGATFNKPVLEHRVYELSCSLLDLDQARPNQGNYTGSGFYRTLHNQEAVMPQRKPARKAKPVHNQTTSTTKPALPGMGSEDIFQWSKTGFDSAVKLTDAVVEGLEHMREMQMHSAHEAHEENEKIMRDLVQARTPADLSQLQMELIRSNAERATKYWQQMFSISNNVNTKLAEEVKNECISAGEKINRAIGRVSKAAPIPAEKAAPDTMKMAMDMTNMTLTNFSKAASQWMDTAKHSLENISATRH